MGAMESGGRRAIGGQDAGTRLRRDRIGRYWFSRVNPADAFQVSATQLDFVTWRAEDPAFLLDERRFDLITLPGVQEDARRYLSEENVVVVTLLPETPVGQ